MAPLVPIIFSNEFNLIIALIAGIGFGFALEQAGFSSTRKLVGLFYGYDFTVLKVFFTAGITAMTGILLFGHLGWLDLSLIYVNPTFLWPAIVGGLIMGAGFVLGGFCPGTSLCAAAVGRIDALTFIGGSLVGILLFTEAYPLLEPLYLSGKMGALTFYDVLGVSPEMFALWLTLIALGAFLLASYIENRVNGVDSSFKPVRKADKLSYGFILAVPFLFISQTRFAEEIGLPLWAFVLVLALVTGLVFLLIHRINTMISNETMSPMEQKLTRYTAFALLPLAIIVLVWITPDRKQYIMDKVNDPIVVQEARLQSMDNDKLAFELMHHSQSYVVIDVRDKDAFKQWNIPTSLNIPFDEMYNRQWRSTYRQQYKTNVFVGLDASTARKAALIALELGDDDPIILDSSVDDFQSSIFNPVRPAGDYTKETMDRYEFHREAKMKLEAIQKRLKNLQNPPKPKFKKIEGGCAG